MVKDKMADDRKNPSGRLPGMDWASEHAFDTALRDRVVALRGDLERPAFCQPLGINPEKYRKYEERGRFPLYLVARIAHVYGVPISDLIPSPREMPPHSTGDVNDLEKIATKELPHDEAGGVTIMDDPRGLYILKYLEGLPFGVAMQIVGEAANELARRGNIEARRPPAPARRS